jgi:hypothetical protein
LPGDSAARVPWKIRVAIRRLAPRQNHGIPHAYFTARQRGANVSPSLVDQPSKKRTQQQLAVRKLLDREAKDVHRRNCRQQ